MSRFPHKFPKGYKQFKVMERMVAHNGLTYTEIIKFAFEMTNGAGSFVLDKHRGYWSGAFVYRTPGPYGSDVNGWITKYCKKGDVTGKYYVEDRDVYEKLQEKFVGLSIIKAKAIHAEKHLLTNQRVPCSNGMTLDGKTISTSPIPEVPMRGIKLDDEVIYYRKRNGQTGDAYIQSIKETSRKIACSRFEISLGLENATIPQLSYDKDRDTFFEMGGFEIQIIKKTL